MSTQPKVSHGPFRAEHLSSGDPYELTNGHPVYCAPTGSDGAVANQHGAMVISTDPMVKNAGIDAGIKLSDNTMRAPDIAVNIGPETPGWSTTVPPLAVEYASVGQDENELQNKIPELLTAGTRWVWVVRLTGPRRVEVYERAKPMRLVLPGGVLTAPGVLKNPVRIEELYDREAARDATLRNLLQREGYPSLDAVRSEGKKEGKKEGIEKGRKEGIEKGIGPLQRQFERKLSRPLTEAERKELARRLDSHGPARLGDVVLDMSSDELSGWLTDPNAP